MYFNSYISCSTILIPLIYRTHKEYKHTRIIVYDKKLFNIDDLDTTYGKKYAKQLGKFYVCATDDFKDNNYRIVIHVSGVNTFAELYAQMCKKTMITKNINKTIKILDEIKEILFKLDNKLHIKIQIYSI